MKKYVVCLLAVCLLLLAGCSGQADAEPFAFAEIADIFDLTEADVQQMYGEPDEVNEDVLYDLDYRRYVFGDNQFAFCNYNGEKMELCEAVIADERISGPREICLGDSLKDVRSKYPDTGSKETYELEGYQNGTVAAQYRVLYGEYVHMSDYGIEVEGEDNTQRLVYSSEGVILRYSFEDEVLVRVEYGMQVV